jgi:hypothetical protein
MLLYICIFLTTSRAINLVWLDKIILFILLGLTSRRHNLRSYADIDEILFKQLVHNIPCWIIIICGLMCPCQIYFQDKSHVTHGNPPPLPPTGKMLPEGFTTTQCVLSVYEVWRKSLNYFWSYASDNFFQVNLIKENNSKNRQGRIIVVVQYTTSQSALSVYEVWKKTLK